MYIRYKINKRNTKFSLPLLCDHNAKGTLTNIKRNKTKTCSAHNHTKTDQQTATAVERSVLLTNRYHIRTIRTVTTTGEDESVKAVFLAKVLTQGSDILTQICKTKLFGLGSFSHSV